MTTGENDWYVREQLESRVQATQKRANTRGMPFNLTTEWAVREWNGLTGRCAYSFMPMQLRNHSRHPLSLSFDRIDSRGGYTMDNVNMCCYCINMMKSDMHMDQFCEVLASVTRYHHAVSMLRRKAYMDVAMMYSGPLAAGLVVTTPARVWDSVPIQPPRSSRSSPTP